MTILGPGEAIEYPRRDYRNKLSGYFLNRLGRWVLGVGSTLTVAACSVMVATELKKGVRPYFGTTEVDGCLVSNDYREVQALPGRGINDLVIRGSNVKAETGPGSECLTAARVVVFVWSGQDGNPRNDIRYPAGNNRLADPIVISNENYRVPIEAFPTG